VRGVFEKCPQLKPVASHLGGGICEMIGRMDYAYNLQEEAYFLCPYEPMLIKHPPSDNLKMMYIDRPATGCWERDARWIPSGGPLHLRNRRAGAQASKESRRRHHKVPQAQPCRRNEGVLAKRTPPAENLMTGEMKRECRSGSTSVVCKTDKQFSTNRDVSSPAETRDPSDASEGLSSLSRRPPVPDPDVLDSETQPEYSNAQKLSARIGQTYIPHVEGAISEQFWWPVSRGQ
jgi:hypothetical protein